MLNVLHLAFERSTGTDKTAMDFRPRLPEIRWQSCLSLGFPRVRNRFGGTTNARAYPAGQTLGQTANFRQTAPEIHVSPGFAAHFCPAPPKRLST